MNIVNASDQSKLVIIKGSGNIREMGNICAPILNPQYVSISIIAKLVSSGRTVLEVNPDDRNQTVQLTLANVRSDNFPKPAAAPAAPAKTEPTKTTAPAAKKEEKKVEAKPAAATPAKVETKTETAKTTSTPASDFSAK